MDLVLFNRVLIQKCKEFSYKIIILQIYTNQWKKTA